MSKIILYTKANCPYCEKAKELFKSRNLDFEEIRIDLNEEKREEMMRRSNRRTVPQIFINNEHIGGYDDLAELVRSGKFNEVLK